MTEKRNSFLKGAIILTAAGFLVKILGAVYRIPLAMMIKDEGMGLYQMAYPIYVTLLAVSTAGLPTAISKMVAGDVAVKRYRNAYKVFKVSLIILTLVGAVLTVALMLSARVLSEKVLGNPKAFYPLISISPAIFFVSVMSCFRGFFQGMQDMTPSAMSQIIEQVGRVVTVFVLATLLLPKGVEYAAAGAAFGPVVGAIAGLLLLVAVYRKRKRDLFDSFGAGSDAELENPVHIAWRLFAFAIPITLGGLIIPVMNLADAAIVTRRLQDAGFSVTRATELYGQLTGMAAPLINLPAVMTMSLAASLVPAISEAVALKNARMVASRAETAVRVTFMFALPAAMGLFILAEPVSEMLYKNPQAGIPLSILSWGIIFLALQQTTTGVLQGMGKTGIPVTNLAVGALFKVFLNYTLTAIPVINIKGAALGTVVGYLISSLLNFVSSMKWTGMALDVKRMIVKPLLATAVMGGVVYYCYEAMSAAGTGNSAATLAAVGMGAFIYPLLLLAMGGLGEEELSLIPGGSRVIRWLQKMGVIRRR